MGVEELRKEILEEANKKVDEILSEARAKAEKIVKEAEQKAIHITEKKKGSVLKSLKEKEKSELAVARIEGKRMIQEKKWELIDLIFKKAVEKLKNYRASDKYFEETLPLYISKGIHSLNLNEALLMVNQDDLNFLKNKLKAIENNVSKKLGRKVKLALDDEPVRIIGGVIISSTDKNVFYNSSFDAKVSDAKEKLVIDILDMLSR